MQERKYRILVADDEQDLCEIIRFNLETEGYDVTTVGSAEDALAAGPAGYDLLLLDVMMAGMSGFSLARMLKQDGATKDIPVIFVTARDTENDTLTGFSLGADDYIVKPFSIRELMMRVKAVLRRTASKDEVQDTATLSYMGLVLDLDKKTVSVDGGDVPFTKTEFDLLRTLMQHRGRVFSRQELIDAVWPEDVLVLDRTVDVNITRLRKKVAPYSACIATRLGFGYYFNEK